LDLGHVPGGHASFRDGPRLAASKVKGRHRILVIHDGPTSLLSAGNGDDESAAGAAYIMATE
jgi:hypothetical protein